jgi:hypothetical protein
MAARLRARVQAAAASDTAWIRADLMCSLHPFGSATAGEKLGDSILRLPGIQTVGENLAQHNTHCRNGVRALEAVPKVGGPLHPKSDE